jgi:hypothetical protein
MHISGTDIFIYPGCKIHIVLKFARSECEDKIDDMKDRFCEELQQLFDKFPKYYMKILVGDFNAKVGKENIFRPIFGNKSKPREN